MRIDLNVPFAQKDEARQLGAKWDAGGKTWYVPEGILPHPFTRWIPRPHVVNLRADYFFLARTGDYCWKCGKATWVYAVYFDQQPTIIEGREMVDGELQEIYSHPFYGPGFASGLTWVNEAAVAAIQELAPLWRLDHSEKALAKYFMNHCMMCQAKHGDFAMFVEPQSPFHPIDDAHRESIKLRSIEVPFEADHDGYHGHELPGVAW